MKNLKLYNEPLRFELIPIHLDQEDRFTSIGLELNDLLPEFDSDFLLRFYTSYGNPTDQVTWLMFKEAKTTIKKTLPNSCFIVHSPEIIRQILFDQGFEELTQNESKKIELDEMLLITPSDKINNKTLLLNLLSGNWTRTDFRDDQGIKEVFFLCDEANDLQFMGDNRMILPKGILTLCTLNQDSLTQVLDGKEEMPEGFQIDQFAENKFMRMEFYTQKNADKKLVAIRFF